MIFLDSNIFLRYFEQDDEDSTKRTERLFKRIIDGEITCFTNSMVIVEIIWVLEKYYEWKKEEVCENIELILNTPNIRIAERNIIKSAIDTYKKINIDFIDSYNYAYIKARSASQIYSYDKHYDRLSKAREDIERLIP
jgi:predicted nucleic-acid-binding protein